MWLIAASGTAAMGATVLAVASALSGTWIPVLCAALAAGATMGAAWLGNRRIRSSGPSGKMTPRERELEKLLFVALKDRQELHDMVTESEALLAAERRSNRQLRRQLREAESA